MAILQSGLVMLAAVSTAVMPSHRPLGPTPNLERSKAAVYSSHQEEFYLSAQQLEYVRPGLNINVVGVTIPEDRRPVVELTFTDDSGKPLDRLGVDTPGALSISFILAWYDAQNIQYTAYTTRPQTSPITHVTEVQASTDSGGTWTDLGIGHARYRFGTVLPVGYPAALTNTLGIYAERDLSDVFADLNINLSGKTYVANVEYDFRPDGAPVTEKWDALSNATCNQCHDPLSAHGGARRDVKLCVLCHSPQSVDPDTGNTVDFKVMIHKIHDGENLPSVIAGTPYEIIGYRQSVHDYSDVAFPQDIRHCEACHMSPDPNGAVVAQAHIWYTNPTRTACGSCHDNINWVTGANHPAGPEADDSECASCHLPQGETEFDASVKGAHTIPTDSMQLQGLNIEILQVTNTAPGEYPTVLFRVTNNAGDFVDPSTLDRLSFVVGGPTTDYATYFTQTGTSATSDGNTSEYTFTTPIPEDATGTWTISADVYRFVTIDNHTDAGLSVRECAFNPIFYVPVTDAQPMPRRDVVELANCNRCHYQLALHGGQRKNTNECVICHNANETDAAFRPADALPTQGIHFDWMIHSIHTGENLNRDFTIYGYHGSVNNYNGVLFPGDRADCAKCHVALPASQHQVYAVPLPDGVLPTVAPRFYPVYLQQPSLGDLVQPTTAACVSCHDAKTTAAHAYQGTAPFGEACASCHGDGLTFGVPKVHAR